MNPVVRRVLAEMTADKKKLGVMVGLLAIGLLLWGRLLLKDVPRTVVAEPADAIVDQSLNQDTLEDWHNKPADSATGLPVVAGLPTALTRDVFVLDATGYRALKSGDSSGGPKGAADHTDREFKIAQAKDAAIALRLEGMMQGDEPSVVINGEILQQGQTINEFTVYRIEQNKVVLEMDGVLIRLSM